MLYFNLSGAEQHSPGFLPHHAIHFQVVDLQEMAHCLIGELSKNSS